MALLTHAAPKSQKVRLPSLFVGSQRLFEPKPTTANYYNPPASTIPKPLAAAPKPAVVPYQPDVAAAQSTAPPGVDYNVMVENDPYLRMQKQAIEDQKTAALNEAVALEQRALGTFGEIPAAFNTLIGGVGVDQATRDLAAANTAAGVSTMFGINKAFTDAQSQYLSSLAARGMLRSGALGQHEGEVGLARDQARFQATQELTDYINSLSQNYLAAVATGNQAYADAVRQTLLRLIAQAQATATPPTTTTTSPQQGAYINSTDDPLYINNYPLYPNLNPEVPQQVYTPVITGSDTSFEPKPWEGNIIPGPEPPPVDDWADYPPMSFDPAPSYTYAPASSPVPGSPIYIQTNVGPYGSKPMY